MQSSYLYSLIIALFVSPSYAHEIVKNPTVKARMEAMSEIASNMKTLGNMARGIYDFDLEKAKTALSTIGQIAKTTPMLFKDPEMDPKSEATLAIWENYDDFIAKAKDLEMAALEAEKTLFGGDDIVPAMRLMGTTCKSCHSSYRK